MLRFRKRSKEPQVTKPGKQQQQLQRPLDEGKLGSGKQSSVRPLKSRMFRVIKKTARKLVVSAAIYALVGIGLVAGGKVYWHNLRTGAEKLQKKKDGLAILISYRTNKWFEPAIVPIGKALIPEYVARVELAFGQKANLVIRGATRKDLLKVLADDRIQNVVLFGHGSWTSWIATDSDVTSTSFMSIVKHKKWGLLVRHTCGIDKMHKGRTFDGIKVSRKLSGAERKLNEHLRKNRIGEPYIQVSFGIFGSDTEMRKDRSTQRYNIVFRLMKVEGSETSLGILRAPPPDLKSSNWKVDLEDLQKIEFPKSVKLAKHPLIVDYLHRRKDLNEIIGYIRAVHLTVLKSVVSGSKLNITLGEGIFDPNKIIIDEGINHPLQWMFNPFGQKNAKLDKYK
jgi:hypothetical protein